MESFLTSTIHYLVTDFNLDFFTIIILAIFIFLKNMIYKPWDKDLKKIRTIHENIEILMNDNISEETILNIQNILNNIKDTQEKLLIQLNKHEDNVRTQEKIYMEKINTIEKDLLKISILIEPLIASLRGIK